MAFHASCGGATCVGLREARKLLATRGLEWLVGMKEYKKDRKREYSGTAIGIHSFNEAPKP